MNALSLPIRADDVAAYLWARADQPARAAACARAQISDAASLLDWYELDRTERIALVAALVDEITSSASRQRQASRTDDIDKTVERVAWRIVEERPSITHPLAQIARVAARRALEGGSAFADALTAARRAVDDAGARMQHLQATP